MSSEPKPFIPYGRQTISEADIAAVVDALVEAAKAGKDTIHELIHDDFPKAGPDEPMNNLFAMFSEKSYPIAIVDENQRLLGVVVKGAVLEQLAEAGEH